MLIKFDKEFVHIKGSHYFCSGERMVRSGTLNIEQWIIPSAVAVIGPYSAGMVTGSNPGFVRFV
jgi:hypothetical protein